MSIQLSLLAPADEDINERIHEYVTPKKYWEELVVGEICRVTPRWGENRLCTITEIVAERFCYITYLDSGETEFMSLICLVPVSEKELQEAA